jgi:hypothetical protein
MFQIDTSTAAAVEPTPAPAGTPGYFTDGNPATNTPATIVPADWFNQVTDELLNVLAAAGIAPSKATRNQVAAAINKLVATNLAATFGVYAGNPNGHVAGTQGNVGTSTFPSVVWDITNNIWWVCTTTGNAAAALWTEAGAVPAWPFWCGTNTGTGNAPSLATPVTMASLQSGSSVAWQVAASNTGAVSVTVGSFGTYPLRKDGPTGPIALTGGELVAGNTVQARFDGTVLHLMATELGTAALANASSNTGKVAAVSGSTVAGHVAFFNDTSGTLVDGGPAGAAPDAVYLDNTANGSTLAPGRYRVNSTAAAFAILLPAAPANGAALVFEDIAGSWGVNNFTINRNGNTINFTADNLVCNVAGESFGLWYDGANSTWRLF